MGLTRRKVKVRGKGGKVYQRSMMVRVGESVRRVGQFVNKHKGKIAAGAVVGGLAIATALAHKRSADRAAAAHAHAASEAASRAAESWARAAAGATAHARVKVDYAKEARRKVSEDISRAEREVENLRNRVNARLHGQHDISDVRRARAARQQQESESMFASHRADNQRKDSARRSGHFTEWVRPAWGNDKVGSPEMRYNIPTHRLGSGSSPPNAAGRSDERPTQEQRRHLNILGHQFERSQERLSAAGGERYRSSWASGHGGVLRLGSGLPNTPAAATKPRRSRKKS